MEVHAWLIDLIHRRKNCPTGMISGWVQKVTEHCGTMQYVFLVEIFSKHFWFYLKNLKVKKCERELIFCRVLHMSLRFSMKERMDSDVVTSIRQWQKDNFHKTLIRDFKEKKDMDDAFKKAQKPWEKKLRDVQKAKHDYYSGCQKERSAVLREKNAVRDTSLSVDQKKKLEEEVVKISENRQLMREKYDKALRDINEYNAKWVAKSINQPTELIIKSTAVCFTVVFCW